MPLRAVPRRIALWPVEWAVSEPVRLIKCKRHVGWERLKALTLALDLPRVVASTAWGEPVLKVHGKL